MTEGWLLERAMALVAALIEERDRQSRRLVTLPPEGATLHEIERAALVAALDRTGWVQRKAAAVLGTTPRVLNMKMVRYDLYDDDPSGRTRRSYRRPTNPFGRAQKPVPRTAGKDWRLRVDR